jgi:hypothetical protein
MKYSVAPEFAQKLGELASQPDLLARLTEVFSTLDRSLDKAAVLSALQPNVHALDGGLHVLRVGSLRVFLTFGEDYALLLDLAFSPRRPTDTRRWSPKDPATNPIIDPQRNHTINPNFNTSLNPSFNTSLNPNFNTSLNPNFNTSLNPNFNTSLNPNFNTSINPHFNSTINPNFNSSINPKFNRAYPGPYVYEKDGLWEGYFVRANSQVDLFFGPDGDFRGIGVRNDPKRKTIFDEQLEWIGYLVSDGQGGYLRFDKDGEWTGFVV